VPHSGQLDRLVVLCHRKAPRLRSLSLFGSRRSEPVIDFGHDFALVDVETTGLYPQSDRVVQIAMRQVDRHGKTQNVWHSLVDPGRDPGPTHIHGITTEMLRGAPRFTAVAPRVAGAADRLRLSCLR